MKKRLVILLLIFVHSQTLLWAFNNSNNQTDSYAKALVAFDEKDYVTAYQIFKDLADKGDANAYFNLNVFYFQGLGGVKKDINKAVECYIKAGDLGMPDGYNTLGNIYSEGNLLPRNLTESTKWYAKAAEHGLPSAKFNLAQAYHYGHGLAINLNKAKYWYEQAVANEISEASSGLEKIHKFGNGISYFMQTIFVIFAVFGFYTWQMITIIPPLFLLLRFKNSKITPYFYALFAFVTQTYFWCAWAAFVVTVTLLNNQLNNSSNYWIPGLILSILPLQICALQESNRARDKNSETSNEHKVGTLMYMIITAAAYATFYFYAHLAQMPYGWLFNRIAFKGIVVGNFFQ